MNVHIAPPLVTPWRRLWLGRSSEVYTLVDEQDWLWANEFGWNLITKFKDRPYSQYVRRAVGRERLTLYLHREIMMQADPRGWLYLTSPVVDHYNGNPLDNRRVNLRWVNKSTNAKNTRHHRRIPSLEDIIAARGQCAEVDIPF